MNTTPAQRAEWAKLDKEATPEPWGTRPCSGGGLVVLRGEPLGCHAHPQSHLQIFPAKDGESIAAYRSAVPALCKDVEQLDGLLAEERRNYKQLEALADQCGDEKKALRGEVGRLTALLRASFIELRNTELRCRIKAELEGK